MKGIPTPELTNKEKFEKRLNGELAKALEICLDELDMLIPPAPHDKAFLPIFTKKIVIALERDGTFPTEQAIRNLVFLMEKILPLTKTFPHLAALIHQELEKK